MAGPLPQPGILEISPYVGGESKVPGFDKPARLASNENPLGPSPKAAEAYARAAAELHRYPDGGATAIRAAIGAHYNLDPARIVCGTGSDELFALLAQFLCRRGRRGSLFRARLPGLSDRRAQCRGDAGNRGGANLTDRCRRAAGRRHAAHADHLPGQPEQPDRQLPADRRNRSGCSTGCRNRCC
jgi:hypothetical protein